MRAIFWCKQTTLNQTTVNMQYTGDIGNLGDDQRRKLQPSFSQKWYFKKKKALTPNKAIINGKMCRNKSIVNLNCNGVILMYVITLYCSRDLHSAKGLQDLRLTNM